MTFGEAIEELRLCKKIVRKGWNGKGMYLFLAPESWIDVLEETKWSDYKIDPFICMKTAGNTIQPGWLASQADMLALDWEVVE